jgi:hypothetical protein
MNPAVLVVLLSVVHGPTEGTIARAAVNRTRASTASDRHGAAFVLRRRNQR